MIRAITNTLALGLGALVGNQMSLRIACHRSPYPMPHQLAAMLEHPWRLRYRHPAEDVGLYGCGPGMNVLDLGCGTGFYTEALADRVGEGGLVHAVDLQRPLLSQAEQRLFAAGLSQRVRFHWCGAYQLPLADASIDLAIVIATLSQIPNRQLALAELARVLKRDGRLVVSEEMPDPAYTPPPVVRRWVQEAGFRFGGQSGAWFCYHQIYFNQRA